MGNMSPGSGVTKLFVTHQLGASYANFAKGSGPVSAALPTTLLLQTFALASREHSCCDEGSVSYPEHAYQLAMCCDECLLEAWNSKDSSVPLSRLSQESVVSEGLLREGNQRSVMEHMQVFVADKECKVFAWPGQCPSHGFNTIQSPQAKTCQRSARFFCCKEAPPWNGIISALLE